MQCEGHGRTPRASARVHPSLPGVLAAPGGGSQGGALRTSGRPEPTAQWQPRPALLPGVTVVVFIINGGLLLGTSL